MARYCTRRARGVTGEIWDHVYTVVFHDAGLNVFQRRISSQDTLAIGSTVRHNFPDMYMLHNEVITEVSLDSMPSAF